MLPVLSKMLERLSYNRLFKFIEEFDILYDFQFGFRKFHYIHGLSIVIKGAVSYRFSQGLLT